MKVLLSLLLLIGIAGCGTGVPAPVWDITVITNGNGTGGFLSSNGTLGVIHNFGLDNSPIYRKNFLTGETHVVDATNQGVLSTGGFIYNKQLDSLLNTCLLIYRLVG